MDPFYGEIRMMAFDYAPQNWAHCNGQQIPINQNQALYSVIGTRYGGNSTTFNLPNLTQKVVMGMGTGPGLTPRAIAATGGDATVTLNAAQMPAHTHSVTAIGAAATALTPNSGKIAQGTTTSGLSRARKLYNPMPNPANRAQINTALAPFPGGGGAHGNMQPSLTLNFCICLYGDYPVRPS